MNVNLGNASCRPTKLFLCLVIWDMADRSPCLLPVLADSNRSRSTVDQKKVSAILKDKPTNFLKDHVGKLVRDRRLTLTPVLSN